MLQPEEYVEKLFDQNCFTFVVVAKELESEKYYVDEAKFQLINPDAIQVKVSLNVDLPDKARYF